MLIVVCPTPRGGHIEHAVNLAAAAAELDGEATVLSRRGSRAYIGAVDRVNLREPFPDLLSLRVPHVLRSGMTLVLENLVLVILLLRTPRSSVVLLEEPRFPLACALRRWLPPMVLFAHNAVNHSGVGAWARAQDRMQAFMARRLPCVVHGTPQGESLRLLGAASVRDVGLPGDGVVERRVGESGQMPPELADWIGQPFVLCLGEIRENKGADVAVEAANLTGQRLVVAGKALEEHYRERVVASAGPTVRILDRFLEPGEFAVLIRACTVLALPYREFSAQSGPLARAMALGTTVILSRSPALLDQARGYERAVLSELTGEAMAVAFESALGGDTDAFSNPDWRSAVLPSWTDVANAVMAAV